MTPQNEVSPAWLAAQLLAVDPVGLGGILLRRDADPLRDSWFDFLRAHLAEGAPVRRMPASIEDDRLLGGVDLTASLAAGRAVLQKGLLSEADGGLVVIPMAERLSVTLAARIASVLDQGAVRIERDGLARMVDSRIGILAYDESASADEQVPASLSQRLAFHLTAADFATPGAIDPTATAAARARLTSLQPPDDRIISALVATAASLGIGSALPPLLALRAARAAAALAGRAAIADSDAILAATLVLMPRALIFPADEQDSEPPPPPPPEPPPEESEQKDAPPPTEEMPSLDEVILAAVQASLPKDLLDRLKSGLPTRQKASRRDGFGSVQKAALRGRPAGARMGGLRPGSRLALVATLRAAAPWQAVRRAERSDPQGMALISVRREDFRLKKFIQRRESTIIFCVDASGSTAFQRLAETKGAVELLLADAYVARTYAALVVFRGLGADLLLPPTRSLSRAKALLANLPGGGGTPLAAGIDNAIAAALSERAKGRDPMVIMLTDGRANIGRDGRPARPGAALEALDAARMVGLYKIKAVFVDTSPRPREDAPRLAEAMGARYVALPYVDASAMRDLALAAKAG